MCRFITFFLSWVKLDCFRVRRVKHSAQSTNCVTLVRREEWYLDLLQSVAKKVEDEEDFFYCIFYVTQENCWASLVQNVLGLLQNVFIELAFFQSPWV